MIKVQDNLQQILEAADPTLNRMVEKFVEWFYDRYQKMPSRHLQEITRLEYTYDLIGAIARYVRPTDIVDDIRINNAVGTLTICCTIIRDQQKHWFETDQILAGGYNIQRLHYRYIAKTELPAFKNGEALKYILARIKAIEKADKLREEIERLEKSMHREITSIQTGIDWTDEQILEQSWYAPFLPLTWATLNPGAHDNFPGGEQEFNERRSQTISGILEKHHREHSEDAVKRKKAYYQKLINALQKKIDELG